MLCTEECADLYMGETKKKHFKVVTFYTYVSLLKCPRGQMFCTQLKHITSSNILSQNKTYLQLQNSVHF